MESKFWCDYGQHEATIDHSEHTTGYGWGFCPDDEERDRDNYMKVCYACCAKADQKQMDLTGRAILYFTHNGHFVSNWPGSLKFKAFNVRKSWHNIGRERYDFNFHDEHGLTWWGYQIGDWNEIAHCRRYQKQI